MLKKACSLLLLSNQRITSLSNNTTFGQIQSLNKFNPSKSYNLTSIKYKYRYQMSTIKSNPSSNQKNSSKPNILNEKLSAPITIMQSIESFIESAQFKKKFNSYYYLQKYSWLCIHTWMMVYRLREVQSLADMINSYVIKKKIKKLVEEYTRDHVYEYDQVFDRQIYEQLKRIQECIFWSLDEYFVFGNKNKQLGQIIEQDFGLWPSKQIIQKNSTNNKTSQSKLFEGIQINQQGQNYRWKRQQEMKKIGQYFLNKMESISNLPYSKIKTGQLQQWLKL